MRFVVNFFILFLLTFVLSAIYILLRPLWVFSVDPESIRRACEISVLLGLTILTVVCSTPARLRPVTGFYAFLIILLWIILFEFARSSFFNVSHSLPAKFRVSSYQALDLQTIYLGTGNSNTLRLWNAHAGKRHAMIQQDTNGGMKIFNIHPRKQLEVNGIPVLWVRLDSGDEFTVREVKFRFLIQQGKPFLQTTQTMPSLLPRCSGLMKKNQEIARFGNETEPSIHLNIFNQCRWESSLFAIQGSDKIEARILRRENQFYLTYGSSLSRLLDLVRIKKNLQPTFVPLQQVGRLLHPTVFNAQSSNISSVSKFQQMSQVVKNWVGLSDTPNREVITLGYTKYTVEFSIDQKHLIFREISNLNVFTLPTKKAWRFQPASPPPFQRVPAYWSPTSEDFPHFALKVSPGNCENKDPAMPPLASTQNVSYYEACDSTCQKFLGFSQPPLPSYCLRLAGSDHQWKIQNSSITLHPAKSISQSRFAQWTPETDLILNGRSSQITLQLLTPESRIASLNEQLWIFFISLLLLIFLWISSKKLTLNAAVILLTSIYLLMLGWTLLFQLGYHQDDFRYERFILDQLQWSLLGILLLFCAWLMTWIRKEIWFWPGAISPVNQWKATIKLYSLVLLVSGILMFQLIFGDEQGVRLPLFGHKIQLLELCKLLLAIQFSHLLGKHQDFVFRDLMEWKTTRDPKFMILIRWAGKYLILLSPLIILLIGIRDLSPLVILAVFFTQVLIGLHQNLKKLTGRLLIIGTVIILFTWPLLNYSETAQERIASWISPWSLQGSISGGQFIDSIWRLGDSDGRGLGVSNESALISAVQDDFFVYFLVNRLGNHGLFFLLWGWSLLFFNLGWISYRLFLQGANLKVFDPVLSAENSRKYANLCFFLLGFFAIHLFMSISNILGLFPILGQPMIFLSAGGANLFFLGFGSIAIMMYAVRFRKRQ